MSVDFLSVATQSVKIPVTDAKEALQGLKSSTLLASAKAFGIAHPLAALSLIGGSLLALGAYDAIRAFREKRQVAAEHAKPAESTW